MSTSITASASSQGPAAPQQDLHEDVDLSCESVAGEEDPGASLDLSEVPEPATPADVPPVAQKVPK